MGSKSKHVRQIFGAKTKQRNTIVSFAALVVFFALLFWIGGLTALALLAEDPPRKKFAEHVPSTIVTPPLLSQTTPIFSVVSDALQSEIDVLATRERSAGHCNKIRDDHTHASFSKVYALVEEDFDWIDTSTRDACGAFDVAMPVLFEIDSDGFRGIPNNLNPIGNEGSILSKYQNQFTILPIAKVYETYTGEKTNLTRPEYKAKIIEAITENVGQLSAPGMCLDTTHLDQGSLIDTVDILKGARTSSGDRMFLSCLVVDAKMLDGLDLDLIESIEKVVVKGFLDPLDSETPQALAPREWFQTTAKKAVRVIGAEKLVLMLGAGGGVWSNNPASGERVGYVEMLNRLRSHSGKVSFQPVEGNSLAQWESPSESPHLLWFLEAPDTFNQLSYASQIGATGIGIWGLGLEDPAVWDILRQPDLDISKAKDALTKIDVSNHVRYSGEGPFLSFAFESEQGRRELTIDETDGKFSAVSYDQLPSPNGVNRWGHTDEKLIALTFDDGPDPIFTGQILDILSEHGVRATFFPVGRQMLKQREVVNRIQKEGHLIGSHTFFHPDLGKISETRATVEMNMQSRLMANITGKEPILFRAPYVSGRGPTKGNEAKIMRQINKRGFIIAGSDVVPPDWELEEAADIANFIVDDIVSGNGNVVLLHDGGGDRTATVEALPLVVTQLRDLGYKFVDLAGFIGVEQSALMPEETGVVWSIESLAISIIVACLDSIKYIFWIAIGLGVFRSVTVLSLAIRQGRQEDGPTDYCPSVTVVVPAYNEEKVIVRTVESILQSNYENFIVLVIDDGSRDKTHTVVRKTFAGNPKVRIHRQNNGGKWQASNHALLRVESEFVVAVDADTLVDPDAIRYLVQKLSDPEVAAVAGNVKVGNALNLLTRLQSIEYITAQNIDRRAFESFNAMMVVPGAIGAWRVSAVIEAGFYSSDTLTEDADLTISLIRNGYKVTFDERAYTYTEAPENVRAFLAQRLRWTLGMMQTGWKHRKAVSEGRPVGYVSLIDLLVFGTILPLLAPIIDIIMLITLVRFLAELFAGQSSEISASSKIILLGYLALPALEFIVAFTAFKYEKTEGFSMLLYLPMQRIFVKQLLTFTVYKALWRAMTGRLANWNKLKRTASVTFSPAKSKEKVQPIHSSNVKQPVSVRTPSDTGRPGAGSDITC